VGNTNTCEEKNYSLEFLTKGAILKTVDHKVFFVEYALS